MWGCYSEERNENFRICSVRVFTEVIANRLPSLTLLKFRENNSCCKTMQILCGVCNGLSYSSAIHRYDEI